MNGRSRRVTTSRCPVAGILRWAVLLIAVTTLGAAEQGEEAAVDPVNAAFPWYQRPQPELRVPPGRQVLVGDVGALVSAVENPQDGDVILIEDGSYRLREYMRLRDCKNITIMSRSRDPRRVTLMGRGWSPRDEQDDILRIENAENVLVQGITFADCHSYGIKVATESRPRNVHILRCHFRNIGMRMIKGTGGDDDDFAIDGSVRFCHFENDKIPPKDWLSKGDYITSIDMMSLRNWSFSDNTFRNIRGRNGLARGAIFIWYGCKDIVIERNLFHGCDRNLTIGLSHNKRQDSANKGLHVERALIRNNFIVPGADAALELAFTRQIRFCNNSIWRDDQKGWAIRPYKNNADVLLINNLIRGRILEQKGLRFEHNITGELKNFFVDTSTADLHLTRAALEQAHGRGHPEALSKGFAEESPDDSAAAEDQKAAAAAVALDFDGQRREGGIDLGADQYASHMRPSGAEPEDEPRTARTRLRPEPKPIPEASADALERYRQRLRERVLEALAEGDEPRFVYSVLGEEVELQGLAENGKAQLMLLSMRSRMQVDLFDGLKIEDASRLAVAVARRRHAPDEAMAAFWLLADGQRKAAQLRLQEAGDQAAEVLDAFGLNE